MEHGFRLWANPSSPHAEGRKARALLEDARERIKTALDWTGEVIFTSGASEALAIGLRQSQAERKVVSAVEHDAVFRAAPDAQVIAVRDGRIDFRGLCAALDSGGRAVVAIQSINSETGTVQLPPGDDPDVAKIRDAGALLLRDCSQSAGKDPLPDADMAVISAHKFGGPIGIGALLVRDFAMLHPVGGHERGYRQGTENLPGALGMAAALEAGGTDNWPTNAAQRQDFRNALSEHGWVLAPGTQCSHIVATTHPTLSAQAQLIRLDALGIAVSAGSACSSGTLKKSRALGAFGIADDVAARTIRVSLGWTTTPEDLARFVDAWSGLSA